MTNTSTTVEHIRIFSDASGCPAVVKSGRYTFAFDTLGDVTCNLLNPGSGFRVESKVAKGRALAAYMGERNKLVTEEWLSANRAMYTTDESF